MSHSIIDPDHEHQQQLDELNNRNRFLLGLCKLLLNRLGNDVTFTEQDWHDCENMHTQKVYTEMLPMTQTIRVFVV